MQITINTHSGESFSIEVSPKASLKDVKDLLSQQIGFAPNLQRLIIGDEMLTDDRRIFTLPFPRSIYIKAKDGKRFPLELKANDLISTVKKQIERKKRIPIGQQVLMANGKQLDDDKTLLEYDIETEATIDFLVIQPNEMLIYAKSRLKGSTFPLIVHQEDRVNDVLRKMRDEDKTIVPGQSLYYNGNKLLDDHTLVYNNVEKNATLEFENNYGGMIKVNVQKLGGDGVEVAVDANDTVSTVMREVEKKQGIQLDKQRLIFNARKLRPELRLFEYKIVDGSAIHLVLNNCPGDPEVLEKP